MDAAQDPAAWGALIVHPADGGSPVRLCDYCAPPWGTEPMPFYIGWTPDGKFVYWNFANATYAIPLQSGRRAAAASPLEESNRRKVSPRSREHG